MTFGHHNGTILHPWQRDTGKYAAQGPNIMLPAGGIFPVARGHGCDIDIIIGRLILSLGSVRPDTYFHYQAETWYQVTKIAWYQGGPNIRYLSWYQAITWWRNWTEWRKEMCKIIIQPWKWQQILHPWLPLKSPDYETQLLIEVCFCLRRSMRLFIAKL